MFVQYIINVILAVNNASRVTILEERINNSPFWRKEFFSSDRVDCNKVDFEQMLK